MRVVDVQDGAGVGNENWGILRGVRPTKLVHKQLDKGQKPEWIRSFLQKEYGLHPSKAGLITEIALRQRSHLNTSARNISIYIGIPFCPSKCLYCSFPSFILPERQQVAAFLDVLEKELSETKKMVGHYGLAVENVYIGGGTPTSLGNEDFARLLQMTSRLAVNKCTREYTIEAGRPDTINMEKIQLMKRFNVNRVSINPQTMQEKTLKYIGRMHTAQAIIDVFVKMRSAGISAINMDVIAGLPGETAEDIADTLEKIAVLQPDNLTVHTLALKKGSTLKTFIHEHSLTDEAMTAKMLDVCRSYVQRMGLKPYYLYRQKYMAGNFENVGYAKPGVECLYNMQIMEERQTILGHGPAAATKVVDVRNWSLASCYNAKDLATYLHKCDNYAGQKRALLANLFEGE
jgi:oxygen-independent coproporphyrinogen-3 oxidase